MKYDFILEDRPDQGNRYKTLHIVEKTTNKELSINLWLEHGERNVIGFEAIARAIRTLEDIL
jgi:hypothetical protein